MDDIFAGRLMSSDVRTVAPDTRVEDAAETMLEHEVGSVLVAGEDNQLEGILTATDCVRIVAERHPGAEAVVSAYMTTEVVTATAQDTIRDIADTITEHGFHHVPVVSATEGVIGVITTSDLTHYLSHIQTPSPP